MIIPAKKLTLVALRDSEEEVLKEIGRLGIIQLRKLSEEEFIGFKEEEVGEIKELEALYERFRELKEKLKIAPRSVDVARIKEIDFKKSLNHFYDKYHKIEASLNELKRKVARLKKLQAVLRKLKEVGEKTLPEVGEFENLFSTAGIIRIESLERLKRVQAEKLVIFKTVPLSEKEVFLNVVGIIDLKEAVKRALSSANFEEIEELKVIPKDLAEAERFVNEELERLEGMIASLEDQINSLREEFSSKAGAILSLIKSTLKLRQALLNTLKSENIRIIQGWVPEDRIKHLNGILAELRDRLNGLLFYDFKDPDPGEEIPTILRNPKLFKVFESITRQYGWPESRESDPTVISGILWIVMFGMMFPDAGHGAVILTLGILFAYVVKRRLMGMSFKRLGKLMIALGISSIAFGLLVGEVFLTEIKPMLPTLRAGWVEDPASVIWLLKIAIFFGIAQIILALIISIRNHLREGEIIEAILGDRGLAGLIMFIGLVLTAFHFFGITILPGVLGFPELKMKVLNHWSFYLMVAGLLIIFIKPIISKEGIALGLGILMEVFISYMANMLSYTRVAGFAIVHAALAIVILKLMQVNPLMGLGVGVIFLNAFALTLEFLVCMIQALRLLYYEFMTKFYRGTGSPYVPWRL